MLYSISHTKSNSKWIKHFNVRLEDVKLLEETKRSVTLIGLDNDFFFSFDTENRDNKIKKINKWDCIKLKSFFTSKEIMNKMKRQLMK